MVARVGSRFAFGALSLAVFAVILYLGFKSMRRDDVVATDQTYAKVDPCLRPSKPDKEAVNRYQILAKAIVDAGKTPPVIDIDPYYRIVDGVRTLDKKRFDADEQKASELSAKAMAKYLSALEQTRPPLQDDSEAVDQSTIQFYEQAMSTVQSRIVEGRDDPKAPFTPDNMRWAIQFARMHNVLDQSSGPNIEVMRERYGDEIQNFASDINVSQGLSPTQAQQIMDAMLPSVEGVGYKNDLRSYVSEIVKGVSDRAIREKTFKAASVPGNLGFDADATSDLINKVFVPQVQNLDRTAKEQDTNWMKVYEQCAAVLHKFRSITPGPGQRMQFSMLARQYPNAGGQILIANNAHVYHFTTSTIIGKTVAQGTLDPAENYFSRRALYELARTNLALKIYFLKHHTYPAKLDDLVSDGIVKSVPIDPYSGKAILYKLNAVFPHVGGQKANYKVPIVYSIGPDGADNGGVPNNVKKIELSDIVGSVGSEKFLADPNDF